MTADEQRATLKIKIELLDNNIKTKSDKVSPLQVRAWRKNKKNMETFLKKFENVQHNNI